MSFIHSGTFAYIKNAIIGIGASVVLVGALFKIQSWPYASEMLTVGLLTETGLFLMMGLLPPHKEYYWEKLYPGLDSHGGSIDLPGSNGSNGNDAIVSALSAIKLDTKPLESSQNQMVSELKTMSQTMSSLDIFAGVDFKEVGQLTKDTGKFVTILNDAIQNVADSAEDVKVYKEELGKLNGNLQNLNQVYGGVLAAMKA